MGALSRRKGAAYERAITKLLGCIFGDSVKRGIGQERAGSEIADVAGVPGWWVQTKHGKPASISIRSALEQAETELAASGKEGMRPLVVVRFDGERDVASLRLDDFLLLLAEHTYALRIIDGAAPPYGLRAQLDYAVKEGFMSRLRALEEK